MNNSHPKGLTTLFFTEMWERMSYYGMRGILVLFMTASITENGLNMDPVTASAIYGIYASLVYLVTLPGGWIADRILGQQRSILYGGIIIMFGHFLLAMPNGNVFYLGLSFVVIGTGLLKPNISALVGALYDENGGNRESGFTIFYMAINIGSILGFFICGYLGENIGWHYGFSAAGFGMLLGLVQFIYLRKYLGKTGSEPQIKLTKRQRSKDIRYIVAGFLILFLIYFLSIFNIITLEPVSIAKFLTLFILIISIGYFVYLFLLGKLTLSEKKKVTLIGILFIGAAFFWSGFDQAGSSFNIFAKEFTDRQIGNWIYPASWLQILNPALVVILSPFIAYIWIYLGKKSLDPSLPFKFGLGLILMSIGFVFITIGATVALQEGLAGAEWLLLTYLFHTLGELTLSPIGLSAISSLSPKRFMGQMMGVWFLASSLGAIIAGLISGQATHSGLQSMPTLFSDIAIFSASIGLILILISRFLTKWVFGDKS